MSVEDQEVVGASEICAKKQILGFGCGFGLEHGSDDAWPRHAASAVGAYQVVDPDADPQLVHADLSKTPRRGEDQSRGSIVGSGAQQDDVFGCAVVHVPGLTEDSVARSPAVRDDHCGAVILDHFGWHRAADYSADGVYKIGEPSNDDGLGDRDASGLGHRCHFFKQGGVEQFVSTDHRLGNLEHIGTREWPATPQP